MPLPSNSDVRLRINHSMQRLQAAGGACCTHPPRGRPPLPPSIQNDHWDFNSGRELRRGMPPGNVVRERLLACRSVVAWVSQAGRVRGVRLPLSGYQRRGSTNESSPYGRTTTRPGSLGSSAHRDLTRVPPTDLGFSLARLRQGERLVMDGRSTLMCQAWSLSPLVPPKRQPHPSNATSPRCACNHGHVLPSWLGAAGIGW